MSDGLRIFLVVLLVLGNAAFVLAEYALVTARRGRLQELAREGKRSAAIALQRRSSDTSTRYSAAISMLDFASSDPLQHWKDDEKKSLQEGKLPGYRPLRMQSTVFQGQPAAIWEFTWQGRARTFRAADLGFGRPGGSEYAIYLSSQKAEWHRHKQIFEDVSQGFRLPPAAR